MKKIIEPNDKLFVSRMLLIPYIQQMLNLARCKIDENPSFPIPRFQLFKPLASTKIRGKYSFFFKIVNTYKRQIIICLLLTFILAILNLLTPQILKQFFSLIKTQNLHQKQIHSATYITQKYLFLQILKIIISAHVSRLFYELSLKVQSTLSENLIEKTLKMNIQCRNILPLSQIYQLQNIDLKVISKMFKSIGIVFQIPFTLTIAIIMLFSEGKTYGIVGLYWIIIAFFLQRWLSDNQKSISSYKKQLIDQRSKQNYQMIQKMKISRLDISQTLLTQINNDYFIQQGKQQYRFQHYQSLFDISLVMLPIFVVISISLYDFNKDIDFTFKDVYLLLSLMSLCYKPLKNIQTLQLFMSEGFHSLHRLQIYLNLAQKTMNQNQHHQFTQPSLQIQPSTLTLISSFRDIDSNVYRKTTGFYSDKNIILKGGQRLVVLGKKGEGPSMFIRSLTGQLEIVNGLMEMTGNVAYLPENNFFMNESILNNIQFYDKTSKQKMAQIQRIYSLLGLDKDLMLSEGLNQKVQTGKFTEIELKKIGLARILCSSRNVYLLDCPFLGLTSDAADNLQMVLREKQKKGIMVIMIEKYLRHGESQDNILILSHGQIQQYGKFEQMKSNKDSFIYNFMCIEKLAMTDKISYLPLFQEFQFKIKNMLLLNKLYQNPKKMKEQSIILGMVLKNVTKYTLHLWKSHQNAEKMLKKQKKSSDHWAYFNMFVRLLPLSQWIFIISLIITKELLYLFIKYQISQQYKIKGNNTIQSMKILIVFDILLSAGLAMLMYFTKYISTLISLIIGNKIYKKSLAAIEQKSISWYTKTHAPLIANKYNRDYGQVFLFIQFTLDLARYTIVLITTIIFIDIKPQVLFVILAIAFIFYYLMLKFLQKAQKTLIRSYSVYKYQFSRVFDEVIEGSLIIRLFGKNREAINKAKEGFINISSYKQSVNSTKISQDVICQFLSTLIVAFALQFGTIIKIKKGHINEALIAVSVLLLLDLTEVFKNVLHTIIKLETHFRLNMMSFIEVIDLQKKVQAKMVCNVPNGVIQFKEVIIKQQDDHIFEVYPLTLKIRQSQKIILYEENNLLRNNLLLSFTNNLQSVGHGRFKDIITIGNINIRDISKQELRSIVAVLMPQNFYFTGTLKQNLQWKNHQFDEKMAKQLAKMINIQKEIPNYNQQELETMINQGIMNKQLNKKIAFMKGILRRPKIFIIKDLPWVIGDKNIVEIFNFYGILCSVIGITCNLAGCEGAERIIYMEKLKIVEDGKISDLTQDQMSWVGKQLRNSQNKAYDYLRNLSEIDLKNNVEFNRRPSVIAIIQRNSGS